MDLKEHSKHLEGFIAMTGIKFIDAGDGYARGEVEIREEHLNPIGSVHGGMIFTLADTIGGFAAISKGRLCTTASSEIHYLNPAINVKKLAAISNELKIGKRMAVIETLIVDENERNIAKVTSTFFYLNEDGKAV